MPHHIHLPVFEAGRRNVVIVVYSGELEAVVRRGYVRDARGMVEFKGLFPPHSVAQAPTAANVAAARPEH